VDRIEASTGYDFLSLLRPRSRARSKQAIIGRRGVSFSGTQNEGTALTFDASASSDPDIGHPELGFTDVLTYVWHFSDGADATGKVVTHTFADNGSFTAALTVTDLFGWQC